MEILTSLSEATDRTGLSGALTDYLSAGQDYGVDEALLLAAATLLAADREDANEWSDLRSALNRMLDLAEIPLDRLDIRRRLALVSQTYLEDPDFACKVAYEGLVEDGPCEILFAALNETGPLSLSAMY